MPQDETGERVYHVHGYHVQRSLLYTHGKSANISTRKRITEKIEPTTIPIGKSALEQDKNESFYLV